MTEIGLDSTNRPVTASGDVTLDETANDEASPGASRIDEFLTGYIVRSGLCLNFDVTERIRLGAMLERCAGALCPQRRLCLSRSLRLHLDKVPGNPWLRRVYDEALLEVGNSP